MNNARKKNNTQKTAMPKNMSNVGGEAGGEKTTPEVPTVDWVEREKKTERGREKRF